MTVINAALLDGLRRLYMGCLYCGEPATQLVAPGPPPDSAYIGICPRHLADPLDVSCDLGHTDEDHGPECDYEPHEPMPLVDLLDALGVDL